MAAHSVSALLQTPSSHAGPCSKLDEPCASAIDLPVLPPTTSNTLQLYCLCMYSGHDAPAPQCSQSNHQNILPTCHACCISTCCHWDLISTACGASQQNE
ncbi:uncharacterized protein SEPMUDRAFT_128160 [Sphaerulina musiva SO2202]|uniref:Uncharacterized protein n=1 Tax=Sphaerulina musiva (strain SO2202) TaxID=692275 RepID=N1QES1_SPHMS|nr:uncharacterized protein SEPMUDRAFT_128160 [Sphaerulina musiva SO2202]EMF09502.1 hypothetical protein SEPMUDRAFT_128160 [Sphaerulina musiva SO2202]